MRYHVDMHGVDIYGITTWRTLARCASRYMRLALTVALLEGVDLTSARFAGDHLGLQARSAREFDDVVRTVGAYALPVRRESIDGRRNCVLRLRRPLRGGGWEMPLVEVFEPKLREAPRDLRPGIEHCAFVVSDYEQWLRDWPGRRELVAKRRDSATRVFVKTWIINGIELELRPVSLGKLSLPARGRATTVSVVC